MRRPIVTHKILDRIGQIVGNCRLATFHRSKNEYFRFEHVFSFANCLIADVRIYDRWTKIGGQVGKQICLSLF